jgi:hypothetical protein
MQPWWLGDNPMCQVINKRTHAAPSKNSVYIGRPSIWGNPFVIGKDGDRNEVIAKYARWLKSNPALCARAKVELKGKNLVCWCAPLPCHGDVLLSLANEE